MTNKELWEKGYRNEFNGLSHNLNYVDNKYYQAGIKQAKENVKINRQNYENLTKPLQKLFNTQINPMEYAKIIILNHAKGQCNLINGIYQIKNKKEAQKIANKTGHAIAIIDFLTDEQDIPIEKLYAIELPWFFKYDYPVPTTIKGVLLDRLNVEKICLPKQWANDVIREMPIITTFEEWDKNKQNLIFIKNNNR